jgi:ABC-type nitrate/sulfonate/bicarbonate transport system permease component
MNTLSKRLLKTTSNTLISLVVVAVLWLFSLWALDVTPYIGKNPIDVFNFLFNSETAAENRTLIFSALNQTMLDASIGFGFGMLFATLVSVLFTLSKGIEQALMPIAMLLRSVPLIAMAPIIILIFGRAELTLSLIHI